MTPQNLLLPFHILLAVDGSEHSLAAAQLIRNLPLPPGSEVTLLGVLAPKESPGRAALMAASDDVQTILKASNVEVKSGLLHGHPAEELSNYADRHQPDLIVVGAKGLHARLGILLGGVAQQVVEYAHWPVLVVRAPYTSLHQILLVTDGSRYSQRAIEFLAQFPLPAEAEISVMHVLPSLLPLDFYPPGSPAAARPTTALATPEVEAALARQAETEEREGKAILAEEIKILKQNGLEARGILTRGEAAGEILDYVKGHQIDLIVAGSRGLSAVKGWLLGSVSRKLVHYAECSVLIVRGKPEPEEE